MNLQDHDVGGAWTGLIWLRIGTDSELLYHGDEPVVSIKWGGGGGDY